MGRFQGPPYRQEESLTRATPGPLWLSVKGTLIGRNEGEPSERDLSRLRASARAALADLLGSYEETAATLAALSASDELTIDQLWGPARRIGANLAEQRVILNKCEAVFRDEIDFIQTARRNLEDSKERIALARALFDDPEGLEADLYVDHIERRGAELAGPVPATGLNPILPRSAGPGAPDRSENAPGREDRPN